MSAQGSPFSLPRITRTTFDDLGCEFRRWMWRIEWRGRIRFRPIPDWWPL